MLTPAEFMELPPLVRYAVVRRCGLTKEVIEALAYEVRNPAEPVPARRIACLRLATARARNGAGLGRRFYRKADLVQFLGPDFGGLDDGNWRARGQGTAALSRVAATGTKGTEQNVKCKA